MPYTSSQVSQHQVNLDQHTLAKAPAENHLALVALELHRLERASKGARVTRAPDLPDLHLTADKRKSMCDNMHVLVSQ